MLKIHDYIYIILKIIVIIAALSWGLMAIDKKYNIIEMSGSLLPNEYNETFQKTSYIIIGLSALYLLLQKKTYFSYLDVTIKPISEFFLNDTKQKDFQLEIIINAKGSEKVLYWTSNTTNEKEKDNKADKKIFENNNGISIVDKDGKAKLYIRDSFRKNKNLPQYLYYRTITNGKLDDIKIINLSS